MPEISRFYGIVIKMFFKPKEHEPSHLHALYGEPRWNLRSEDNGNDGRRSPQKGSGTRQGMDGPEPGQTA